MKSLCCGFVVCLPCVLLLTGSARAQLLFTEIYESAGLPLIDGGHGAAWADADGDGRPDLYLTLIVNGCEASHDRRDLFLHNAGGGRMTEKGPAWGIADDDDGGSHGAAWADLDNDGDYDLINAATVAEGTGFCDGGANPPAANDVYRNDGAGEFSCATAGAIAQRKELTRALIALDWDSDGDLDLFGIQGAGELSATNELYRNDGEFRFAAITEGAAYDAADALQGATDTDFDGDGDVDILTAGWNGPVILKNDGRGGFTRIDPGVLGLPTGREAANGVTTADVDNDGDLDILLASATRATSDNVGGTLYLNNGRGRYSFGREFTETNGYTGGFADLDNDGDLDLVFAGDDVAYLNDGAGNFDTGPAIPHIGSVMGITDSRNDPRAVAFADLDDDGDLDFAVAVKKVERNLLIRNEYSGDNSWLKVRLISPEGQAGAFGARTRIYPAGSAGGTMLGQRESKSNYGYLAQDDPVLHFGLGGHKAVDVEVTFLDRTTIRRTAVAANQTITVDGRRK